MIKFVNVNGTQDAMPEEFDFTGSPGKVYIRKNIKRSVIRTGTGEDVEESPCWNYDEALVTMEDYDRYIEMKTSPTMDLIKELQEVQSQQDLVIAEILLNTI